MVCAELEVDFGGGGSREREKKTKTCINSYRFTDTASPFDFDEMKKKPERKIT